MADPFSLPILIATCRPRLARAERLAGELARRGYAAVEVVEGAYWRDLDRRGPWRWDGEEHSAMPHWTDPFARRIMTLGEVACTLTHFRAWRAAANNQRTLILEDDVSIGAGFGNMDGVLADLAATSGPWGACYVSHRNQQPLGQLAGRYIRRLTGHPLWTCGYLVSREGAERLLTSGLRRQIVPADDYIPAVFGIHSDPWLNRVAGPAGRLPVFDTSQNLVDQANTFGGSLTERAAPIRETPRITVLSVATDQTRPECERYRETAERYGFQPTFLGGGESGWATEGEGGGRKIALYRREIREMASRGILGAKDVVLCTDAYDVVFASAEGDVLRRFKRTGASVLFSAERYCWPDRECEAAYPPSGTPWRFLNSGAFIGFAAALDRLLDGIWTAHGGEAVAGMDDQRLLTAAYLADRDRLGYDLDRKCEVFMSLNGSYGEVTLDRSRGTLVNNLTGSRPAVIHTNGPDRGWLDGAGACVGGRIRSGYGGAMRHEDA